ncbi:Uncharacterised protein [uncultured Leptotrichia sp.]|uniref:hypothetical protein n=1 Tax=uncultured Leptotrichia sp. TaxID=159271 RepID=UPI001A488827|nr:hypothetical protein [uncultured Leptotrichia sp.]VTX47327.1 Uncharacterised protein [uncultured Leptotrichia sp.]
MEKNTDIEEICKNDILKLLSEIERNYSNDSSLIMKLIKNQRKPSKLILEIENEEIRKKTKIYSLEEFKEKIKEPIEEYLNKMGSQNILLDDIKQALNNFLFQVEYQFGNYLSLKKSELIFKESGEKNSKEEMFQKMYGEAQKADTVLEYIILRTRIKEIIQSILLISSIFEIKQIRNEFVERLKNSQEEINKIESKIKEYDEKISNQDSKLKENNKKIKKQEKVLKNNTKKINNHDKRILEMMGTFLTIFSILGMNVLTIPNIKDNIVQNIIIINATILLTMSGLFFLIRFEFSCKKIVLFLVPIILAGVMIFFATVNIKDKNKEIESRIETVIKENKTLKQEIEILKRTK